MDGIDKRIFPLSVNSVYAIVRECSQAANLPALAPHDLRRTYAYLSREGGAPLEQISQTLGHSSVTTTERYLNLKLELKPGKGCGDYIQLSPSDSESTPKA
jgi:integrase